MLGFQISKEIIHKKNFWCEKIIYDITFAGDLPYCASSVDARGTDCFTCSILWRIVKSLRSKTFQVKWANIENWCLKDYNPCK